jgi:hypothetical protein
MSDALMVKRLEASYIKTPGGCWWWTGRTDGSGYGRFSLKGVSTTAHRAVMVLRGHDVEGMEVDHLCRNRRCVNPLHLEVVTKRVNSLRSMSPPAINARRTQCYRGHKFTPENTYVTKEGWRYCRACSVIRTARYKRRKKARTP